MADTIRKYATKKGTYYEVRYRKPDGHDTRKRGFARKMDAELWAAENVEIAKARARSSRRARGARRWVSYGPHGWRRKAHGGRQAT